MVPVDFSSKRIQLTCTECVVRLHIQSVCESVLCIDADFYVCNCVVGAFERYLSALGARQIEDL